MEDNKLFSEFPPVSTEKWEEAIHKDLKGADYDKKLVWKTIEGFNVKPYYRAEDLKGLEYLDSNPAQAPYTRGKRVDNNVWDIRQDIDLEGESVETVNAMAVDAVKRGANALGLSACKLADVDGMKALLKNINLEKVKINFMNTKNAVKTLEMFLEVVKANGYDVDKVYGSISYDMYDHALRRGHYRHGEDACYAEAKALVEFQDAHLPHFRVLAVNGRNFSNAGSNIVQELGFTLAAANDLMVHLTDMGLDINIVASNMIFNFAIGSNYFMEIAKIRAARMLWSKIAEQYKPTCPCCFKVFINSTTSKWNKSIYDPYVNMLRTTTETMSAVIAGADSVTTDPFDCAYKEADDFGYRIGRNQQLLLKEESYMDKIVDPAAGSYYVENLTNNIAQNAWNEFLAVEKRGGFAKAIAEGYVQDEVEKMAQKRDMDIATRKTVILGTNQYPNLLEKMSDKVEITDNKCGCKSHHQCKCGNEGPTIKVLHEYRGAEPFEHLRMATEKSGYRPKVFLLTYGNLAMRKARSGFATNFFGVAGYQIIDNAGFETAEEGIEAALKANADIVVMCSSDEEYAEIAEKVCNGLKGKVKSIVLAGYPKDQIDTYKGYGVDEFIHVKTNVLECLTKYNEMFGF